MQSHWGRPVLGFSRDSHRRKILGEKVLHTSRWSQTGPWIGRSTVGSQKLAQHPAARPPFHTGSFLGLCSPHQDPPSLPWLFHKGEGENMSPLNQGPGPFGQICLLGDWEAQSYRDRLCCGLGAWWTHSESGSQKRGGRWFLTRGHSLSTQVSWPNN